MATRTCRDKITTTTDDDDNDEDDDDDDNDIACWATAEHLIICKQWATYL